MTGRGSPFDRRRSEVLEDVSAERLEQLDLLPEQCDAAFVSGSRAEGWANGSSDVDAYVVASDAPPRAPNRSRRLMIEAASIPRNSLYVGGRSYDVEYWRPGQVERLLAEVDRFPVEGIESAGEALGAAELRILHGLTVGVAVRGEQWLDAARARLTMSAVRRVVACHYFNQADSLIEDVVGMLHAGDERSAVLAARGAFDHTVDGLLAYHGDFAPSGKWRARKFERTRPPELPWDEYWALQTMTELSPSDPGSWVRGVARRCQMLIGSVELG